MENKLLEDSKGEITDDYKAFIDFYGKFKGKYSRRLKIFLEGMDKPSIVQMNVHPVAGTDKYIFVLYVLNDEKERLMEYRKVEGVAKPVSRIVFGTASDAFMDGKDQSELLDAALDAGINTIDTARKYGLAEKSIGIWLEKRDAL